MTLGNDDVFLTASISGNRAIRVHPNTKTTTSVPNPPTSIGASCKLSDGRLLFTGNATKYFIYDVRTNTWTSAVDRQTGITVHDSLSSIIPRLSTGAVLVNAVNLNTQFYNTVLNTWTVGNTQPTQFGFYSWTRMKNGNVLIKGSYTAATIYTIMNALTGTFSTIEIPGLRRLPLMWTSNEGHVYVAGGSTSTLNVYKYVMTAS